MSLRPYSRSGIPSVTQVIGCFSLEDKVMAMSYSASKIGAETGDSKEFRTRWDKKRLLGTQVHAMAVKWAAGESVDSTPETEPYLDGLQVFYDRCAPTWLHLEQCIGYDRRPRRYVGSFDAVAELSCPLCQPKGAIWPSARCFWLLDLKTTGKGPDIHLIDWTLQLSAYRWADRLTTWESGSEVYAGSMPLVAHTGVLWLKDTGEAELVNVPTTGASFTAFLQLLDIYNWAQDLRRGAVNDKEPRHHRDGTARTAGRRKASAPQADNDQGLLGV